MNRDPSAIDRSFGLYIGRVVKATQLLPEFELVSHSSPTVELYAKAMGLNEVLGLLKQTSAISL